MKRGFDRYQLTDRVMDALPAIGFHHPTPVQHLVMPLIIQKKNLIVEAATGTGKTAAYALPFLSRIDMTKRSTQMLVLVPSRELARQVEAAFRTFTTHEQFRIAAIYGGMSLEDSERKVKAAPHVLIAVPGRLKDVLRTGKHDYFWRDVKFLVIDEADKLLEFGFQKSLDNLVSNVRNMVQVTLFSATISADVEDLIRDRFYPLKTIRLSPKEALKNIRFHYIYVDNGQKQRYLAGLLNKKRVKQALIFCSKREEVLDLANFLRANGRKAQAYHGLLDQVERAAIMKRFKNQQVEFLVATDLAARGLDVEKLPMVINYSFPDDVQVYLHRCGRTGRAGEKGKVFNLVASKKEVIIVESFHNELKIKLNEISVKPLKTKGKVDEARSMVKVHLSRGKRDKVRAGDVLGFLTQSLEVDADKVGTIAIYEQYTLIDLSEEHLRNLLGREGLKLKKKSVKVSKFSLASQKKKSESLKKKKHGVRDKKKMTEIRKKRMKEAGN